MTEREALWRVPFQRGLQYIHAALLTQGAHCVRPGERRKEVDALFSEADSLAAKIRAGFYSDED